MNRDDIIRMAVECQLVTTTNRDGIYIEALERFAELVAAAERARWKEPTKENENESNF
jgi:hypothetical protein